MERRKVAKSEKQYLRGMIHNLSLQKWTDQDIVDYLRDEKNIDIGRSTVTKIKNQIEKEAEKWYIELRQSTYKYIATYKERLDSLLSYQKKLNDILDSSKKEETKIRAITALQSIELDIFNIFKQMPDLRIEDVKENKDDDKVEDIGWSEPELWGTPIPVGIQRETNRQDQGQETKTKTTDDGIHLALTSDANTSEQSTSNLSTDKNEETEEDYVWKLLKCPTCGKSFYNNFTLSAHQCVPGPII
jgi:hypothetical protein